MKQFCPEFRRELEISVRNETMRNSPRSINLISVLLRPSSSLRHSLILELVSRLVDTLYITRTDKSEAKRRRKRRIILVETLDRSIEKKLTESI